MFLADKLSQPNYTLPSMLRQSGDFAWRGVSPAPGGLIEQAKAAIMTPVSENAGNWKRGGPKQGVCRTAKEGTGQPSGS